MVVWFVCLLLLLPTLSHGLTHLAINATDIEKNQWNIRRTDGPYKSDWDILKARADAFRSSPTPRWQGVTTSGCYQGNATSIGLDREFDWELRDAAFVYFVTGDTSYVANVRQELLEQAGIAGTNFATTSKWCITQADATTQGFGNGVGVWLRKLAYAYSYIKPTLSAADINTLDTWFRNAGTHIQNVLQAIVSKPSRFPNRLNDDYTPTPPNGGVRGLTHAGGPTVYGVMDAWNNEGTGTAAALAVIARLVNNNTMRSHASRFVQEWLKYGTFPGGHSLEEARWAYGATTGTPQHGYLYTGQTIGSILTAIDALARDGYINLFDYSTSVGMHGTEGAKSVRQVLEHYADLTSGAVFEYAATSAGNAADRIDPVGPEQTRIEYINLAHGNLHYQDASIKAAYEKAIPGSYNTVGCDMLGSDWCHLPGVRFMYGGLEGVSLPYGGTAAPEPDFTSTLTMHLKFDEGTGATAQDSTANNHDGTLSAGATWGPAKMGASAVALDGTATGIVTVTGELGTPAAVTLSAWVKMSAFPTPEAHVLSIGDSVQIAVTSTLVRGWYYTGTNWSKVEATRTLGTTDWHHLAFVAQAGTQQLYLDGALVASGSNGSAIGYAGLGTNTILGGHGAGITTNYRFQGSIDDARVYGRALSATDISGLAALADPSPLAIQITAPTTNASLSTDASPLTNMGGTASDGTGVTGISYTCPTCTPTSDAATCSPACGAATTFVNWSIPSISLATGSNLITLTATDASGSATDALTVTYTPPVVGGGAACTHYASPAGGGNGSAPGNAFRVADFWAVATPGKVLCLVDGTYSDSNARITVPTSFAGTASQPITIRALNDGKAYIAGGTSRPVNLQGAWGILQGITVSGGDNKAVNIGGTDWLVQRLMALGGSADNAPEGNIDFSGERNTCEDCAAIGIARKQISLSAEVNANQATCRRCWAQFESNPTTTTSPTNSMELGYGQNGSVAENVLLTRRNLLPPAREGDPDGVLRMFRTENSRVHGALLYGINGQHYDNSYSGGGRALFATPGGGSAGFTPYLDNVTMEDIVIYLGTEYAAELPLELGDLEAGDTATYSNSVVIADGASRVSGSYGDGWTITGFTQVTPAAFDSANKRVGGQTIWERIPGLCKRYTSQPTETVSTLTTEGLWPWPMNQRIIDGFTTAGRAADAVNITATMEGLFGPIPTACQTGGGAETCTPPRVGTPPTCNCPAGTVEPLCEDETPPETCPPECPAQDVFVIATATASPPGSDSNACTLEAPCLTINRARSLMTPTDTLYLRGGTYTGEGNRITTSTGAFPSGNSWDVPTRIAAYAGETVILQQTTGTVITLDNATTDRYLVFDRLSCDGASTPGNNTACINMTNGVHHIRVQNSTLRNTHFRAVLLSGVNNIEFLNTTIHGATHSTEALLIQGTSDSLLLDGVTWHSNNGHGLSASGSGITNLTVKNSVARNNGGTGFLLGAPALLATNILAHTNALGVRLTNLAVSGPRLYHATVADNSGNEVQIDAGATDTVLTNVLAVGGIVNNGTGTVQTTNYTGDPGFEGGGSYKIASGTSPAADTGTCLPGVVDIALDGVARPQPVGGACDIGAYERAGEGEPVVPTPGPLSARPYGSKLFFVP